VYALTKTGPTAPPPSRSDKARAYFASGRRDPFPARGLSAADLPAVTLFRRKRRRRRRRRRRRNKKKKKKKKRKASDEEDEERDPRPSRASRDATEASSRSLKPAIPSLRRSSRSRQGPLTGSRARRERRGERRGSPSLSSPLQGDSEAHSAIDTTNVTAAPPPLLFAPREKARVPSHASAAPVAINRR